MSDCIERVVAGTVEVLSNGGSITRTVKANHHEWLQAWRGDSQDGFFCRFCLTTAYYDRGVVVVNAPVTPHDGGS